MTAAHTGYNEHLNADAIYVGPIPDIQALKQQKRREYRRLLADENAKARSGKPMSLARAERLLTYHDSYSRLDAIIGFAMLMNRRSWLRLLGKYWSGLDNLYVWDDWLRRLLPGRTTLLMMNEQERAAWHEMSAAVTVYRGCSEINMMGLSWSLCPEIAAKFPTLMRYAPPAGQQPLLLTGQVAKSRITAINLDRDEQEIIALNVRRVRVLPLEVRG